jgi:hypothetical protein
LVASVLLLLPNTAFSVELFEGNLGYEGDWLHVAGSTTMTDRVYWYELGDDLSYQVQFAYDADFLDLVLDQEVFTNYIAPGLGAGFYYFRVREIHPSGAAGSWSDVGTLEVVEDLEPPTAQILSPLDGQAFSIGDSISIQLEVSDDTVLRFARFTIGGEYAGTLGLKTENYKLKPSLGQPRTVVFDYQLPAKGKAGALEISAEVSDVTYKAVTSAIVIDTVKGSVTNGARTSKKGGRKR